MKLKLFFGVVLVASMSTPIFAQWPVIDWANVIQASNVVREAKQAYALEQQIHAFVKNPGSWKYLVQTEAMQMGRMAGIPLPLLNASNVMLLSQSRQSAMEAMQRAAGISNLTNENASLGSLLGIQAAQSAVQERQIQAEIDSDTQITTTLSRGTGIGPQAAKIANWEMK